MVNGNASFLLVRRSKSALAGGSSNVFIRVVAELALHCTNMLNANRCALGVDDHDIRVIARGHFMTGSTPVTGLSSGALAYQGFGELQRRELFPNPPWTIEEIGMPEAGTDQGFLKQ